jgi:hypothetical protein
VGARHCVIDGLLPEPLARRIHGAYPPAERMRHEASRRLYRTLNLQRLPAGRGRKDVYEGTRR